MNVSEKKKVYKNKNINCEKCSQVALLKKDVNKNEEENKLLKSEFTKISRDFSKIGKFEIILDVVKKSVDEVKESSDTESNKITELILSVSKKQSHVDEKLNSIQKSLDGLTSDGVNLKNSLEKVISAQEREALNFAIKLKSSFDKASIRLLTVGFVTILALGGLLILAKVFKISF